MNICYLSRKSAKLCLVRVQLSLNSRRPCHTYLTVSGGGRVSFSPPCYDGVLNEHLPTTSHPLRRVHCHINEQFNDTVRASQHLVRIWNGILTRKHEAFSNVSSTTMTWRSPEETDEKESLRPDFCSFYTQWLVVIPIFPSLSVLWGEVWLADRCYSSSVSPEGLRFLSHHRWGMTASCRLLGDISHKSKLRAKSRRPCHCIPSDSRSRGNPSEN